ncbi:MAG: hypothetical protein ACLP1D_05275, partial [Xanthobacteraceae bacterium]
RDIVSENHMEVDTTGLIVWPRDDNRRAQLDIREQENLLCFDGHFGPDKRSKVRSVTEDGSKALVPLNRKVVCHADGGDIFLYRPL